jgi:hypothetical protein
MRRVLVLVIVAACGGGSDGPSKMVDAPAGPKDAAADAKVFLDAAIVLIDAPKADAGTTSGLCNPLTQAGCVTGEKCTWLLDALMPTYVGHIGCAPVGTATVGQACMYGAPGVTGYDACAAGASCAATIAAAPASANRSAISRAAIRCARRRTCA